MRILKYPAEAHQDKKTGSIRFSDNGYRNLNLSALQTCDVLKLKVGRPYNKPPRAGQPPPLLTPKPGLKNPKTPQIA
jgi:hypothetical protein